MHDVTGAETLPITDVRVTLTHDVAHPNANRLVAYASVAIGDAFVVHNFKVTESMGEVRVWMPAARNDRPCASCRRKIPVGSNYCPRCGAAQPPERLLDRREIFRDVAHPIRPEFRAQLIAAVLDAYRCRVEEVNRHV